MLRNDSLNALLAIKQAGSLSSAAKSEEKTASQLRHAIRTLEDDLELSLLSRENYRAQLTDQGQFIANRSQRILSELEDIDRKIKSLAQRTPETKQLRVGFLDALPLTLYGNTLWQLQQYQPELCLHVEQLHTVDILQRLEQGTLDFGIALYHRNSLPNLTGPIIGQGELVTVVSPNHPLAASGLMHNYHVRTQYLQLSPRSYLGFGLDSLAQNQENKWELDSFELIVALLEQGLGWSDVPRHWVEPQLSSGTLIQLQDNSTNSLWCHLHLLWHKDRDLEPAEQWLIEQLAAPRPGLAVSCLPLS